VNTNPVLVGMKTAGRHTSDETTKYLFQNILKYYSGQLQGWIQEFSIENPESILTPLETFKI
jgi:hypothetical protein